MIRFSIFFGFAFFLSTSICLASPIGSPSGTYNASQVHSGAFTETGSNAPFFRPHYINRHTPRYIDQPAWPSYANSGGANALVTWHKITVTKESKLHGISGHGQLAIPGYMNESQFELTISKGTIDQATAQPFMGTEYTVSLTLERYDFVGTGMIPGFLETYNVSLKPQSEIVLSPGHYWITVVNHFPGIWMWNDVSVDNPLDYQSSYFWFYGTNPSDYYEVRGQNLFGNGPQYDHISGVAAIDVWMSPTRRLSSLPVARPDSFASIR